MNQPAGGSPCGFADLFANPVVVHRGKHPRRDPRTVQLIEEFLALSVASVAQLSGAHHPAAALLQNEDSAQLQAALAALPVEFREVILLRHQEGLSYKQIAAITDLPPGTVMSRLARARTRLRESLARISTIQQRATP